MSYYKVIPCHITSCDVAPLGATSCDVKLCHIWYMSHHLVQSSHIMSQHILPIHIMSCYPNFLASYKGDLSIFLFFFLRWVDISYKIKLSSIPFPTNEGHARKISLPSSTRALRFVARPTSFAQIPPFPSNACQSRGLDFTSLQKISLLFPLSSQHSWNIQMPAHPW